MAARTKGTTQPAGRKAPAAQQPNRAAEPRATPAARGVSPQQIMREAAWSRMFGRAEAKNPFER